MSGLGFDDLRERKFLLGEEDKNGTDNIEFSSDKQNGSPRNSISATQFGGVAEPGGVSVDDALVADNGHATDSEVEIFGDTDRRSLISSTSDDKNGGASGKPPFPEIDKDGVVREYEVALKHLGFGLFHCFLLFVNGIALSSDAVEVLSISFVLPVLYKPEEFGISDGESAVLSSIIFLGMLFGSYFWGSLADIAGRRTTLLFSLALSGLFGLASAFAPTFWVFILLRFCSGFGVGGSLPVLFPYNSEFIRNKYRGPYLGVQSTFWMVGRLLCGAFAWMIIPIGSIHGSFGSVQFHSWRLFIAVSAMPSILGALLYFILPESPRYLLEVGKERKAVKILERVYKINHLFRKNVPEFPIKSIHLEKDGGVSSGLRFSSGRCDRFTLRVVEVLKRTRELFCRKLLRRTALLMLIQFCLAFGSYGVSVWYPTYVSDITDHRDRAQFEEKCQQNVTDFGNIDSFHSYCGCNLTIFQDFTISNAHLESWMVGKATFSNVTFNNVTFNNVIINSSQFIDNCVFRNSVVKNSKFVNLNWDGVSLESLNISSSFICDLRGNNETMSLPMLLYLYNTSLNGGRPLNQTTNITSPSELLINPGVNSTTCDKNLLESKIDCEIPDSFTVYRDSFFISASALPGNIASAIAVYFLRRNYWLAFSLLSSTASVFLLYIVHSEVFVVIMLCLFTALSTPAWNDTSLIIAEVYPTHLRATAAGIHLLMGRIGAIFGTNIFGAFVRVNPSIPILIVAGVLLVGGIASLPLPKTTRKTLLK